MLTFRYTYYYYIVHLPVRPKTLVCPVTKTASLNGSYTIDNITKYLMCYGLVVRWYWRIVQCIEEIKRSWKFIVQYTNYYCTFVYAILWKTRINISVRYRFERENTMFVLCRNSTIIVKAYNEIIKSCPIDFHYQSSFYTPPWEYIIIYYVNPKRTNRGGTNLTSLIII